MNGELVSQHFQRKQFGRAPILIEDVLRALHDCWWHGTTTAVQRSIRLKRYVEEYGERAL
jgi:hypothetical protein